MSTADRQQAQYFDELLGCLQGELDEQIEGLYAQVLTLDRIGDDAGVSRTRRTIRVLETELRTIERMREGLRFRLEIVGVGA